MASAGVVFLAGEGVELMAQQADALVKLAGLLAGGGEIALHVLDGGEAFGGIPGLGAEAEPGLLGFFGAVLAAQGGEVVHLPAVAGDGAVEFGEAGFEGGDLAFGVGEGAAGAAAGGGEQLVAGGFDLREDGVAAAAGDFAEGVVERLAEHPVEVAGGVADRLGDGLGGALGDPQQAGDAPVLALAAAFLGELEAEEFGQLVLGVGAVEVAGAQLQIAAGATKEALGEPAGLAVEGEIQLDGGGGAAVAPGLQVFDAFRAVALEEGGADGGDEGALARFVGAGEHVEAGLEAGDLQRLAELTELLDAQAGEFHRAALRSSARKPASRARASRAGPSGRALRSAPSSAITSPR